MRFEGTVVVRAAREAVWRFLTDPRQVSQCAPGVEALEVLGPERFRARAAVGFGSVKAQFQTEAEWLDLEPPSRARMKVHGTAPGSAVDAQSEMRLDDGEPGTTVLRWSADVAVLGTLASLAARLMGSVAQRLTDAFFDAVRRRIEAQAPETPRVFRFGPRPVGEAVGAILAHDVAGHDGRVALAKGRVLTAEDAALLSALGRSRVDVAQPGEGDLLEDEAAQRVAQAALGEGLRLVASGAGRANLVATQAGLVQLDPGRLWRVNACPGLAVATLREHTLVAAGDLVATVKVVPFALPAAVARRAEEAAADGAPLLHVRPLRALDVAVLLTGAVAARESVQSAFEPALRARLERWGSRLRPAEFVALDDEGGEEVLAARLRSAHADGAGLVLIAGETAIVDRHDRVPRAVEMAGGEVAAFGVPVDPGQLLMLAYLGALPIVGAPGCARSPKENVIDLLLPRLLAGEILGPADLIGLGHGGLRADVPERARPR